MVEITRALIARVGVDLSKRVYQVHAVDRAGRVVLSHLDKSMDYRSLCNEVPDFVTVGFDGLEIVA